MKLLCKYTNNYNNDNFSKKLCVFFFVLENYFFELANYFFVLFFYFFELFYPLNHLYTFFNIPTLKKKEY